MVLLPVSIVAGFLAGLVYNRIPIWLDRQNQSAQNTHGGTLPKSLTMLLDAFEEERLKHQKRSDVINLVLFSIFGGTSWAYFTQLDPRMAKAYFFALLFFGGIMWIKSRFFLLRKFTKEYKTEVLGGLIAGLDPRLEYTQDKRVGNEALRDSGLFGLTKVMESNEPLSIEGEDYIHGSLGEGVDLQISDLEVYRGEGEQVRLVFAGTFLVVEFPEPFEAETYVMPDFSGAGVLQDLLHQVSNKKTFVVEAQQVQLNNPEFEKVYDVFSTKEESTKNLINSKVQEHLLALDNKSADKVLVACSFKGNRMYMGSLFTNLRFEPSLHRPVNRAEDWQMIYTQLELYLQLINALQQSRAVTPANS